MKMLLLALYAEGSTDARFLPARKINLDILYLVPSYREFFLNFKRTLAELNFISWDHSQEGL